ncbi:MAG: serine/threonine protein kinase [Deltaproteobacteria bacterium]|nr:MAG: serine/threonine protein kinase [Deltaproteobacteria bacterium]
MAPDHRALRTLAPPDDEEVALSLPSTNTEVEGFASERDLSLVGELGRGGMGAVHLAREDGLNRLVAVKVLGRPKNTAQLRRFVAEAQVTAQLEHPNIVPVYRIEQGESGEPAFSMKVIRGENLRDRISQARKAPDAEADFPLSDRLEIFAQVCDAVAYAHSKAVVHRDLKPENIMVGGHHEVYVMDWGIARVLGRDDEDLDLPELDPDETVETDAVGVTRIGEVIGTPAYLSPEQARAEASAVGPASDQYALGLLLYELVKLVRARDGGSGVRMVFAAQVNTLPELDRDFPPDLAAIFHKACADRPAERYASVDELAADVRRYLHGEEVSVRPRTSIERLGRWGSQRPTLIVSLLSAILLLAGGFAALTAVSALAWEKEVTERNLALTRLVEAAHGRAHAMDVTLLHYESLMDGLAHQMEAQHERGQPQPEYVFWMRDALAGRRPPSMAPVERYGDQNIDFALPVVSTSPGVGPEEVADEVSRLAPAFPDFRRAILRSHSEAAVHLSQPEEEGLLRGAGVPGMWIYVGLESGVLVNYPANDRISSDYDARKRPWYRDTLAKHEPHWGKPYYDDSGAAILVPCNEALLTHEGKVFGVMGFDVSLDVILRMLTLDIPGVEGAHLVQADGTVIVDSSQAALTAQAGLHDNLAIGTERHASDLVAQALADGLENGHVEEDGLIHVYSKLSSVGWWYVVDVDPSALLHLED